MQIFHFRIEALSVMIIEAWPDDEESDPDIYVSNTTPFVSQ